MSTTIKKAIYVYAQSLDWLNLRDSNLIYKKNIIYLHKYTVAKTVICTNIRNYI